MGVSVKFRKFGRQVLDRLGRGEPASRIAADLGIASSTVSTWARQGGLAPYRRHKRRRKPENIARDMAIIDLMSQEHFVNTVKRVDPHGRRVRGTPTVGKPYKSRRSYD